MFKRLNGDFIHYPVQRHVSYSFFSVSYFDQDFFMFNNPNERRRTKGRYEGIKQSKKNRAACYEENKQSRGKTGLTCIVDRCWWCFINYFNRTLKWNLQRKGNWQLHRSSSWLILTSIFPEIRVRFSVVVYFGQRYFFVTSKGSHSPHGI